MTVGNYNEERIPWGKTGEPRGSNEVRAVARHHVPNQLAGLLTACQLGSHALYSIVDDGVSYNRNFQHNANDKFRSQATDTFKTKV